MIAGVVASQITAAPVPTMWNYTGTGQTYTPTTGSTIYPDRAWPNGCLTQLGTVDWLPFPSEAAIGDTHKIYGYAVNRFGTRAVCTVYIYTAQ